MINTHQLRQRNLFNHLLMKVIKYFRKKNAVKHLSNFYSFFEWVPLHSLFWLVVWQSIWPLNDKRAPLWRKIPASRVASLPATSQKTQFKMKKKQSPKKTGKEHHIPKAQRGNNETIDVKRCLEPAILTLRKVSSMARPPTPIEVENRLSDQVLGPVFVPNKFMNGGQNYTHYARSVPSASWPSNRSPVISKVEGKPSNFSEVYRASKIDAALASSLPAVDRKAPLKLSNEEFKSTRRASFLPKIDGKSKTNSGSFHNIVAVEQAIKRSPQTSSEVIKLPPAKVGNSNITCKENSSSQLASLDKTAFKNTSPEDIVTTVIAPKPPSVSNAKDRSSTRRKNKRRKDEDEQDISLLKSWKYFVFNVVQPPSCFDWQSNRRAISPLKS